MFTSATMRNLGFTFVNICLTLLFGSLFIANSWAQEPFLPADTLIKTFNEQKVAFPLMYEAEMLKLIAYIPDHTLDQSPAEAFSKTYYSLLTEAWDIPSDNPGGIGSEEWLYYFLTGNGEGSCTPRVLDFHQNGMQAQARFVCDSVSPQPVSNEHTVDFQFDGTHWVIADFDGTAEKLHSYIQSMRTYFRSAKWAKDLKKANNLTRKEWKMTQQKVSAYFAKYPKDR